MNTASTSGSASLPGNTIANPKGKLKAITTRSGIVLDGLSVHIPPPFINPEEDERVEEILTDQDLGEYTITVPPPFVQKSKPPSQRVTFVGDRSSNWNRSSQEAGTDLVKEAGTDLVTSFRNRSSYKAGTEQEKKQEK
nr:hypothetical protein [Tanacetum cinerariifolium]